MKRFNSTFEQKPTKPLRRTKLIIKGELTDLNAYIKALNSHRYAGSSIKREETNRIYYDAKKQCLTEITAYPVKLKMAWYCRDNRKDIDNVAFAKKFILDGLVAARVLENDSRRFVSGFTDEFFIDKKNPRVEVEILQTLQKLK